MSAFVDHGGLLICLCTVAQRDDALLPDLPGSYLIESTKWEFVILFHQRVFNYNLTFSQKIILRYDRSYIPRQGFIAVLFRM